MPATLQWYEGDNTVDGEGRYPGDESGLRDLERMVGDTSSGRRFTDDTTLESGAVIPGTTPTRTEALTTLQRAEDAFIEWLATGGYVTITPTYATTYASAFRTLLEARAALAAVRVLSTRPTHERDSVLDEERGSRRIDGFAYQVRGVRDEILSGTFPLPRREGSGSISVGFPASRDPIFTFELET